jgi:fructose/tagatose bisphosphate aldolase
MKSLLDFVKEAEKNKVAIGHFNISNLEMLRAIFNAARNLNYRHIRRRAGFYRGKTSCGACQKFARRV